MGFFLAARLDLGEESAVELLHHSSEVTGSRDPVSEKSFGDPF